MTPHDLEAGTRASGEVIAAVQVVAGGWERQWGLVKSTGIGVRLNLV